MAVKANKKRSKSKSKVTHFLNIKIITIDESQGSIAVDDILYESIDEKTLSNFYKVLDS